MALFDCSDKGWGICSLFCPHPGGFDSLKSPHPREFAIQVKKKTANARGEGGGAGRSWN